ncbi:ankyrin [Nemania abortiva]|nr:ankyrin [Nemania abortiva]
MAEIPPRKQSKRNVSKEYGITVLSNPSAPTVDVCFVHGFTGHPMRTWTSAKRAPDTETPVPSPKKRVLYTAPARDSDPKNDDPKAPSDASETPQLVCWPRDLVPKVLPNARVLTFGYDTNIRRPFGKRRSENSLENHADDFLFELETHRRDDVGRPLIFVAHSLGGLLVKETLGLSKSSKGRSAVYMSTKSLFFFGTPHAGADPRKAVHHFLSEIASKIGYRPNPEIVKQLMPGSKKVQELASGFLELTKDRHWSIYTFQEELPHVLFSRKIVDDTSSSLNLDHETRIHIHADHVDMCRFKSANDEQFLKVAEALGIANNHISSCLGVENPEENASSQTIGVTLSSEEIKEFLKKLNFKDAETRYNTLQSARPGTCGWILEHHIYKLWINSTRMNTHHRFLWIKGKAGTGKSTAMKYLCQNRDWTKKNRIVLTFFFNARGTKLEHSTEGMYRSLIWQLVNPLRDTSVASDALSPLVALDHMASWPIEALKDAFRLLVQIERYEFYCFIDALDEGSDINEVRDMLFFLEELCDTSVSPQANIKVCVSSRHFPNITIRSSLQLVLESEDDHTNDIRNYIHSKLTINDDRREGIEREMLKKSSNIFLWACLVTDILNKENDEGGDLQKRLREIPEGLNALFQDILTRDGGNIGHMILCIQCILFAKAPLHPRALYFAIQIGNNPNISGRWNADDVPDIRIGNFNLHASKGLTEMTSDMDNPNSRVQFIHESVPDYLLGKGEKGERGGLQMLFDLQTPQSKMDEGLCQNVLRDICLKQVNEGYRLQIQAQNVENVPFLHYAVHHVLAHAESAQSKSSMQLDFLNKFPTEKWVGLHNTMCEKSKRHPREVDLLYILAEKNLWKLIGIHPQRYNSFEISKAKVRFPSPLVAAMAWGSNEAIFALAFGAAEGTGRPQDLDKIRKELHALRFGKSISSPRWKGIDILSSFCLLGSSSLIDTVLDRVLAAMNMTLKEALNNIQVATNANISEYLISKGADINAKNKAGETALSRAVKGNEYETARNLLEAHAGPNVTETSATSSTIQLPSLDSVRSGPMAALLIKHGARHYQDIPHLMGKGIIDGFVSALVEDMPSGDLINFLKPPNHSSQDTILHAVLKSGGSRALPLLRIVVGINSELINQKDDQGDSLLRLAASHDDPETLQFLCAFKEADLNSRNSDECTPLCGAIVNAKFNAAKHLLDRGATSDHLKNNTVCKPLVKAIGSIKTLADGGVGDMNVLKTLLQLSSPRVDSALVHKAIETKNPGIVEILLPHYHTSMKYQNINSRGISDATLLSTAARTGNSGVVKLLLSTYPDEIDVNCPNNEDYPPLLVAIQSAYATPSERVDITDLLLASPSVDVNYRTSRYSLTPLLIAVEKGYFEIVKRLLSHRSIDCNIAAEDGHTPLYEAIERGNSEITQQPLSKPSVDCTPSHEAAKKARMEIIQALLGHHSLNFNFGKTFERNPLLWAAKHAVPEIVKLLLCHPKVGKKIICQYGKLLLDYAKENQHPGVLELVQQMLRSS